MTLLYLQAEGWKNRRAYVNAKCRDAYATDGTNQWFAKAAKGCTTDKAGWMIVKIEYTGQNWITKYPVDATSDKATDAPKFVWDNYASLTYRILGT